MLGGPVGEPVLIELLQVSAAAVHDGRAILPERGRRRIRLRLVGRCAIDGGADVAAHQIDHRVDVDALRHVGDEPDERRHADEGQQNRRR